MYISYGSRFFNTRHHYSKLADLQPYEWSAILKLIYMLLNYIKGGAVLKKRHERLGR